LRKTYALFLIISLLGLTFFLPNNYVKGSTDLVYTPTRDLTYTGTNPAIDDSFNLSNMTTVNTGLYNASYSFTNDVIGDDPLNWDIIETGGDVNITNEAGHTKVVLLNDTLGTGNCGISRTISKTTGTYEYWFMTNDSTGVTFLTLEDTVATTGSINFRINGGEFRYRDTASEKVIMTCNDNQWYHIRIEFDASTDWHLWINGVSKDGGGGYGYYNTPNLFDMIRFQTAAPSDFLNYLDGIGFNWLSNYSTGVNRYPIMNQTFSESKTVDRYEFSFEGINNPHDFFDDNPNGWSDIESIYDYVDVVPVIFSPNAFVGIQCKGVGVHYGLEKDDFATHGDLFNITFGFENSLFTDTAGLEYLKVYSYDDTEVMRLRVNYAGDFSYYDGSGYNTLLSGLTIDEYYEINAYINYYDESVILMFFIDGIYEDTYYFPLMTYGKEGVNWIELDLYGNNAVTEIYMKLDYVGIYLNGSSIVDNAYGFNAVDFNNPTGNWNYAEQNLFSFNGNGNYTLIKCEQFLGFSYYGGYADIILNSREYDGTELFYNTIERMDYDYDDPSLVAFLDVNDIFYNITKIEVEGVYLVEGVNSYYPTMTYSNINVNESYFYGVGNSLRFKLLYDDSNLEYIRIDFNIPNNLAEDRSGRFMGDRNGNFAQFRFIFTDASYSGLDVPISYYTQSIIFDQSKILDKFALLITDNDDYDGGNCTGYITAITLVWNPDIALTITSLNLLGMITILLIIIIPTLVFSRRLGSKVVIPILLLMSLLCVTNGLIPVWLFVVIAIGLGSIFLVGYRSRGGI